MMMGRIMGHSVLCELIERWAVMVQLVGSDGDSGGRVTAPCCSVAVVMLRRFSSLFTVLLLRCPPFFDAAPVFVPLAFLRGDAIPLVMFCEGAAITQSPVIAFAAAAIAADVDFDAEVVPSTGDLLVPLWLVTPAFVRAAKLLREEGNDRKFESGSVLGETITCSGHSSSSCWCREALPCLWRRMLGVPWLAVGSCFIGAFIVLRKIRLQQRGRT